MNLAVTSSASTWNTIKRHYLSAITLGALGGLALFGAFAISNQYADNTSSSTPAQTLPAAVARPAITSWPAMTYFIVDSQALLIDIETAAQEQKADDAVYSPNRHWKYSILLATTPAEVEDALGIVEQAKARWKGADASGLEVIDLRTR